MLFKKWKLKKLIKKAKKLHKQHEQSNHVNLPAEITAVIKVASFYDANRYNSSFPRAEELAFEYYRVAAKLDDPQAQYICGQRLMEKAKFWDQWAIDVYGDPIHKKYATDLYEEAFQYLKAAEDNGYSLAKRLRGLAYIHGWGVPQNTQAGFQYVLDSIEMDNAWNRATKILEELNLSSPEFFKALMEYKAGRGQ